MSRTITIRRTQYKEFEADTQEGAMQLAADHNWAGDEAEYQAVHLDSPEPTTPCDECGNDIRDSLPDLVSTDHKDSCSLYPHPHHDDQG